jgi:competence protein ComEC
MSAKQVKTRFRAYKLGNPGSSFSYCYENYFTLIEARLNECSMPSLVSELAECGKEKIDCLHITSWDNDHCNPEELKVILSKFSPKTIEKPGYDPHTDDGKDSEKLIDSYKEQRKQNNESIVVRRTDPAYIKSLDPAEGYGYKEVCYWPKEIKEEDGKANDNSSVKLFRSGSFNVLSTGDVEDHMIGLRFLGDILKNELDVLILPHHGSKNGCVQQRFLKETAPAVTICSSDFDNQHEHPSEEIKELLFKHEIPCFTTKTGDVIVRSTGDHSGSYEVVNLIKDSSEVSSVKQYVAKKRKLLSVNKDTLRARIQGKPFRGPK